MRRVSVWGYRALLWLYPAAQRRDYGAEMLWVFTEALQTEQQKGLGAVLVWWWRVLLDTVTNAYKEHQAERYQRITQDGIAIMPRYSVWQWAVVLVPLLGLIVADALSVGHGTLLIYIALLGLGLVHWVLSCVGWVGHNPLLASYIWGVIIGISALAGSFAVAMLISVLETWEFPLIGQVLICVGLYAVALGAGSYLLPMYRRAYGLFVLGMIAIVLVQVVLGPQETVLYAIPAAINMQFALLIPVWGCLFLWPYQGKRVLIVLFVALGLQFMLIDPAYFTGGWGRWIDSVVLLVPLVLSPILWVGVRHPRLRVQGVLLLWLAFTLFNLLGNLLGRAMMRVQLGDPYYLDSLTYVLTWGLRWGMFLLCVAWMLWLIRQRDTSPEAASINRLV
jgi:hypothetical protein